MSDAQNHIQFGATAATHRSHGSAAGDPDRPPCGGADEPCNIASHLPRMASMVGERPGVIVTASRDSAGKPRYAQLTFAELEALSNRYANGLAGYGLERGMRILLMVRPGFDFVALVFALFKLGTVPVMIDPGMGARRLLECIRQVDLHAFVGVPLAHLMRVLRPGSFRTVKKVVTVGRRWLWGGPTLAQLARGASESFDPVPTRASDTAAILFTSGSTGPAKGVVYEHGMFDAQVRLIQAQYGMEAGEVDLPAFPLFSLFSTAMGMTSVIPDMDPSRPAEVNPAHIVEAIRDHGVTSTFGSPAIWKRVAEYGVARGVTLPSLKRILVAGAPVPSGVIEQLHQMLSDDADVYTPYGATESLPVASISGRELFDGLVQETRSGRGFCVGRAIDGVAVRVMTISDEPVARWSDDLVVAEGAIGEFVVSGPVVTKAYFGLPEATAAAKIVDGDRAWHRIGDVGYRDDEGRLWFCGRKAHRVVTSTGTMFSVCAEAIFNEHPEVHRSALVGVGPCGHQVPVIVIEPRPGKFPRGTRVSTMTEELLALGGGCPETAEIRHVLFHNSFPVDVRHNAKINREQLAAWAGARLR